MAFFLCFCTYAGQTENELDMIDVNVLIKLNQSSPNIKRWHTKERQLYLSCHLKGQSQDIENQRGVPKRNWKNNRLELLPSFLLTSLYTALYQLILKAEGTRCKASQEWACSKTTVLRNAYHSDFKILSINIHTVLHTFPLTWIYNTASGTH